MKNNIFINSENAKEVAFKLIKNIMSNFPCIFKRNHYNKYEHLVKICRNNDMQLIRDKKLPCNRKAFIIDVEDKRFILIDKLVNKNFELIPILAHELGHEFAGHLLNEDIKFFPLLNDENSDKFIEFLCKKELEAEIIAWFLVLPDNYLNKLVQNHIFIPTRSISHELGLNTEWVAARVELYRKMYGYEESKRILEKKEKCCVPWNSLQTQKWFSWELTQKGLLNQCLKRIEDEIILQM